MVKVLTKEDVKKKKKKSEKMLDIISIKEIESNHIFLPSEKLKQKITTKNIPRKEKPK